MKDAAIRPAAGEPARLVLSDPDAVAEAAAGRIAEALADAVRERGRADWATTGGSAPIGIYRLLAVAPLRDRVPWRAVHMWWGDDRYVPRDHPLSNVLLADQVLMNASARAGQSGQGEDPVDVQLGYDPGAPIPVDNVHPFPLTEALGRKLGPAWAATRYEQELKQSGIAVENGWPVFDLVLLGVGPDGHIMSVFPDAPTLDEERAWAVAVPAPAHVEPHVSRVTLNPRVLEVAREILVVTHGEGKAEILERIFGAEQDPRQWPAQLARRPGATWILDRAAAARLSEGG